MYRDARGLDLTTTSEEAATQYNAAVDHYFAYRTDVNDLTKATLAADPAFTMGHVLRGYLMMQFGTAGMAPAARKFLGAAEERAAGATRRERMHVEALRAWTGGRLDEADRHFEHILDENPHDLLAVRMAHYNYFWLGDRENLRRVAERVLPEWDPTIPGYGYLLGMAAFGREECGAYREAEATGRRAIELNPGDHWATHAVAHVMEMEGRHRDGIEWLDGLKAHWEGCNNFTNHLWWHRAMYHWELEQYDTVLDLYDHRFRKDPSDFYLDIQNAVSMLWRLELRGFDVGRRWEELAEKSRLHLNDLQLPFSDMHYVMALLRAGDRAGARCIIEAMREYGQQDTTYAPIVKAVSLPVAEGMASFTDGRFGETVDRLLPLQGELHRAGGSHAQRDVVTLTLIEAALRAERHELALALLDERTRARPTSPGSWQAFARALAATNDPAANQARATAEKLLKGSHVTG